MITFNIWIFIMIIVIAYIFGAICWEINVQNEDGKKCKNCYYKKLAIQEEDMKDTVSVFNVIIKLLFVIMQFTSLITNLIMGNPISTIFYYAIVIIVFFSFIILLKYGLDYLLPTNKGEKDDRQ